MGGGVCCVTPVPVRGMGTHRRGDFLGEIGFRAGQKRSYWEGSLRLILDTVDCVWGALRSAVPSQDVFEVAGLEFHVLKKIRGVLSNVSCRKWDQGKQMSLWAPYPSLLTNFPKRGSED